MDKDGSKLVILWWIFITIISIFNISFISKYLLKYNLNLDQRNVTILAFIYTVVCGLRSFYPKNDVKQNCLFKSFLSIPIFGRSIATIAEISFINLVVLIFKKIVDDYNFKELILFKKILPNLIPVIVLAQIFCWSGCLTKNYLYNTAEETLWLVTFSIILLLMISLKTKVPFNNSKDEMIHKLLFLGIPIVTFYLIFLISNDIPMYFRNWKENKKNIRNSNFIENIKNFSKCSTISWSYKTWEKEIPWQTGYFTSGVWCAIGLALWFNKYLEM